MPVVVTSSNEYTEGTFFRMFGTHYLLLKKKKKGTRRNHRNLARIPIITQFNGKKKLVRMM
jgi:hypothetical protein